MPVTALALINPVAGEGRAEARWPHMRGLTGRAASQLVEHRTTGPGDAARRAADWVREGHRGPIIVAGGDGTVHEVLNGLHGAGAMRPIAIIPSGTGNDFVRNVGASTDPFQILPRLDTPGRRCDLGLAAFDGPRDGSRTVVFGNSVSAGVSCIANCYAQRLRRLLPGPARYAAAGAWALLAAPRPDVLIATAEGEEPRHPLNVTVANGPSFGGGMRIAPGAVPYDGRLELVVIGTMSKARGLLALTRLRRGAHVRMPEVRTGPAALPVMLRSGTGALEIEADGQNYLARGEVRITVLAGALEVIGT